MLLRRLLPTAVLTAAAVAQTDPLETLESKLSPCVKNCSLRILADAGCQLSMLRDCICRNATLQSRLSICTIQSCSPAEQDAGIVQYQETICKGISTPSRSREIIRDSIILTSVTLPILLLRIISRYMIDRKVTLDEWLAILLAVLVISMTTGSILLALKGFGKHFWDIPVGNHFLVGLMYYGAEILYVIAQNVAKGSILLFYLRLFPENRFRTLTKYTLLFVITHSVAFVIAVIFQCWPIRAAWDPSAQGKCSNFQVVIYVGAAFSIMEDIIIILLPIPQLWSLNLSYLKRIALVIIFAIGSFACVTSLVRIKYFIFYGKTLDLTWEGVDPFIWSVIEVYCAVICGSLLSVRTLFNKCWQKRTRTHRSNQPWSPNQTSDPDRRLGVNQPREAVQSDEEMISYSCEDTSMADNETKTELCYGAEAIPSHEDSTEQDLTTPIETMENSSVKHTNMMS